MGPPCPSFQTSDSPRKLNAQLSNLFMEAASNSIWLSSRSASCIDQECCFTTIPLKPHLAVTLEVRCLGRSYYTLAAMTLSQTSPSGICRWWRQEL
ncbi:hypothetical protein OS493_037699 [Desmophyllum pertusum]|uniref:Uncharacterized protein n=1 Tax=Desmophyllum pertusum TaxID=174260 RepID=A0A9W9Y737_9CNID|nr:hypothetical protein OS493_037699 [Desmophyllum pertusum]